MTTPRKTRVAIVYGGRGPAHAASCGHAASLIAALDPGEFEAVPVGIARDGRWMLTGGVPQPSSIGPAAPPDSVDAPDPAGRELLVHEGPRALSEVDIVFPVLTGVHGEDGTLQGLLEMAGIPYVGASVFASAATADREFTRTLAAAEGIPVIPYVVLRDPAAAVTEADRARLGLPVRVRPAKAGRAGAAVEVTEWARLPEVVEAARQVHPKVLVEAVIVGREIECGVLEGEREGAPEASMVGERRPAGEIDIPAGLPERVTKQIQEYARQAYSALDCAGVARVSFLVTPELDVYLTGIDTLPDFAAGSL
ncbi:MAG TPA: D-alanine--D-alanine ligase A, partial [Pilimelia sp.]|nr:D-alanine--D-alanine ligase A [Pilimelia sp.]